MTKEYTLTLEVPRKREGGAIVRGKETQTITAGDNTHAAHLALDALKRAHLSETERARGIRLAAPDGHTVAGEEYFLQVNDTIEY